MLVVGLFSTMVKYLILVLALAGCTTQLPTGISQTIEIGDSGERIFFEITHDRPKSSNDMEYTYFFNGELLSEVGGYTGLLLDGRFERVKKTGELVELGEYRAGVKNGVWKRWGVTGQESFTYERGKKNGNYQLNTLKGYKEEGSYLEDKLHGVVRYYRADTLNKVFEYKNGVRIDTIALNSFRLKLQKGQQ